MQDIIEVMNPYESYDLPGRKTDNELKSIILEQIRLSGEPLSLGSIAISVEDGIVILTPQPIGHTGI